VLAVNVELLTTTRPEEKGCLNQHMNYRRYFHGYALEFIASSFVEQAEVIAVIRRACPAPGSPDVRIVSNDCPSRLSHAIF
jgi:hypothetical protein